MGIPCLVFFCLITWLGRGTGLIILIYFHHNFKQSLNVSLRYEMLYFMKPFSMVPIGRLGHLGCGTVPTSLKLAWHFDPACRGHRPSVRYFGLCIQSWPIRKKCLIEGAVESSGLESSHPSSQG